METVMFENYHYFLKLAETNNVTQAARELFVTHQCLSRYLAKLEKECGTALFYRKPRFTLTPEGRMLLDTLRQVESLEMDIRQHFREGLEGTSGTIRVGTTEGRFRIFIPPLITSYSALYPHMHLAVTSARPDALEAMMLNNKLDLMLIGQPRQLSRFIKSQIVLQERLYVVLSDAMCRKYFPEAYAAGLEPLKKGIAAEQLIPIPFSFNLPSANSSLILDSFLKRHGVSLKVVHVSNHPDLHHILTTQNYAASFCLTMYLPNLKSINERTENKLHVFPILGLDETNPVAIAYRSDKTAAPYFKALIRTIKKECQYYQDFHPDDLF